MLSRVSKLSVKFAPLLESSGSAKEFLSRVRAPKAQASNPDCQVEVLIKKSCEPVVSIEFSNGQKEQIFTSQISALQVIDQMSEKSRMLEARDILKKAGLSSSKIDVLPRDSHNTGSSKQIPIV